jgi:hypothetical protein
MKNKYSQVAVWFCGMVLAFTGCTAWSEPAVTQEMTYHAKIGGQGLILNPGQRFETPKTFRPPVAITIVAKTDSTDLRIGYAADQMIFNWEVNLEQLRVDGGPANGHHQNGAGSIPRGKFVTIQWLVATNHQAIYVNGKLRFKHTGDYSAINRNVSVFPAMGSIVTVKSVTVRQLSPSESLEMTAPPQPDETPAVSTRQIQKWMAQLNNSDFSKREDAVKKLAQFPARALPALNESLQKTTDEDRRWWLQAAIQECQEPESL